MLSRCWPPEIGFFWVVGLSMPEQVRVAVPMTTNRFLTFPDARRDARRGQPRSVVAGSQRRQFTSLFGEFFTMAVAWTPVSGGQGIAFPHR